MSNPIRALLAGQFVAFGLVLCATGFMLRELIQMAVGRFTLALGLPGLMASAFGLTGYVISQIPVYQQASHTVDMLINWATAMAIAGVVVAWISWRKLRASGLVPLGLTGGCLGVVIWLMVLLKLAGMLLSAVLARFA